METEFTPYASLAGGLLIGIATVLLMATQGRVFGATGIVGGLLQPASGADAAWRLAILAGMVSGPLLVLALTGQFPAVQVPIGLPALVAGGLIVGVGVTYGSGCTSGHGVCGLARLSPRSAVATGVFMLSTAATVYVSRHLLGA